MQNELMAQIPSSFYVVIGGLVLANLGTVVSVLYGVGRAVWWASHVEARLTAVEKDMSKDLNAAFEKIRKLEKGDI